MFDKNVKFIDIRFISCKPLLVQLLKLIGYIQYSLEQKNTEDIILTVKIKNLHKAKLLSAINDKNIPSMPHTGEIIIGE